MLDRVVQQAPLVNCAERLGSGYANGFETSFSVLPEAPIGDLRSVDTDDDDDDPLPSVPDLQIHDLVVRWQEIALNGSDQDRLAFAHTMLTEWNEGRVFFPIGFIWGRSAVGAVNDIIWDEIIHALGDQAAIRKSIDSMPYIIRSAGRMGSDFSTLFYKFVVVIQLSTGRIQSLDEIRSEHLQLLADVLRPNGIWVDWIPRWHEKGLRRFANSIAEVRRDPTFGQAITREQHIARPPRTVSPVADRPDLQWVVDRFEQYMDERRLLQKKHHRRSRALLLESLVRCPAESVRDEKTAFSRSNMQIMLATAREWSTPETRLQAVAKILDFASWLQDVTRDERGLPTIAMGLTNADVERFRSALPAPTRSSDSEVVARPMPARYHRELKNIITENDFAWPKSILYKDKPAHWITHIDPETGEGRTVFCEVLSRVLLLMLDLPLRGVQARRLDSGEGDDEAWDRSTGQWTENRGANAGYWRRAGAQNRRRGVLRKIASADRPGEFITGFYINSNKTQDKSDSYDEHSGYEIPWEFSDVIQNIAAMRAWQEKYNPVSMPLASKDTPPHLRSEEASKLVSALVPERFYLFRYPLNGGVRGNEAPPKYKTILNFFYQALDELERRLNLEDPDNPIRIISRRYPSGAPRHAIFTLHGLRSSTITSLYTEGVPIAILSKLVAGHATILMTLSYVKYDPLHVSEILTAARQKAVADDTNQFRSALRNASFQEAAQMTARLQDDGLQQAKSLYAEPSTWSGLDIGICPNGATLCQIGGEVGKGPSGKKKARLQPVPGGGRNCVRCRFFVTGLPFLIPLWGHANMLSARASTLGLRIEQRDDQLRELKRERHELSSSGSPVPEDLRRRIMALEAEWDADMAARDQTFADFHATLALIEKVRTISRQEGDGKLPMLLPVDGVPEVTGRESTRFELADSVVQMSRFFPSLESAELERERDQFLDRILYNGGYVPITLGPLPIEDRRRAADALAAFLIAKLGAAEAENLIEGRKTLADLGLQQSLEEVVRRSVGAPLTRLDMRPQPALVLELSASEEQP